MDDREVLSIAIQEENGGICWWSVNDNNVEKMKYHCPIGEGDQHFVDVYTKDGGCNRVLNCLEIIFSEDVVRNAGDLRSANML
jgi:hypothetical protein